MPEFIQVWAQAIAGFEGFFSAGTRPARNNNPGDLKYAGQPGAVGQDSAGFAVFPDAPTGWQALYNQLAKYVSVYPNFSILQIMAHYLGQSTATTDSQGNAFAYADTVANALGVTPDVTLAQLAAGTSSSSDQTVQASGSAGSDQSTADASGPGDGEILAIVAFGALAFWAVQNFVG